MSELNKNHRVLPGPPPAGAEAAAAVMRQMRKASEKLRRYQDYSDAVTAFRQLIQEEEKRPADQKAMDPFDFDLCCYAVAFADADKSNGHEFIHQVTAIEGLVFLDKMKHRRLFPSSYWLEARLRLRIGETIEAQMTLDKGRQAMCEPPFVYHWPGLPDEEISETNLEDLDIEMHYTRKDIKFQLGQTVEDICSALECVCSSRSTKPRKLTSFKCTEGCSVQMDMLCWMAMITAWDVEHESLMDIFDIKCQLRKECKGKICSISWARKGASEIKEVKEGELIDMKYLSSFLSEDLANTFSDLSESVAPLKQVLAKESNARSEIARLKAELADRQKNVKELKAERAKHDKEIGKLRKELEKWHLGSESTEDLKEKYQVERQKWSEERERLEREKKELRKKQQESAPISRYNDELKKVQIRVQNLEEGCEVDRQKGQADREKTLNTYSDISKLVIVVEADSMRQALNRDLAEMEDYGRGLNFLLAQPELDQAAQEELVLFQKRCQRYAIQVESAVQDINVQENSLLAGNVGEKGDFGLTSPNLPKKPKLSEPIILGHVLPLLRAVCTLPESRSIYEIRNALFANSGTVSTVFEGSKENESVGTTSVSEKVKPFDSMKEEAPVCASAGQQEQLSCEPNPGKTPNMARLTKVIQGAFPSTSQFDLTWHLDYLREKQGGSLSGWPIPQIIEAMSLLLAKSSPPDTQLHTLVSWSPAKKVPKKTYDDECCICFDLMVWETSIGLKPCNHRFHTDCIQQWLREKRDCPVCRKQTLLLPDLLCAN